MDLVEAAVPNPQCDLVARHARLKQLPTGDYSVLARGKRRDYALCKSSEGFSGYMRLNPTLDLFAPTCLSGRGFSFRASR
jgi:hypothetical protein